MHGHIFILINDTCMCTVSLLSVPYKNPYLLSFVLLAVHVSICIFLSYTAMSSLGNNRKHLKLKRHQCMHRGK